MYEKPPFYHKPFKPSPKMTKKNVRFFSHFGRGAYLVDIKLIISQFLKWKESHGLRGTESPLR